MIFCSNWNKGKPNTRKCKKKHKGEREGKRKRKRRRKKDNRNQNKNCGKSRTSRLGWSKKAVLKDNPFEMLVTQTITPTPIVSWIFDFYADQNHPIMSGPVSSLNAKCDQFNVLFSIYPVCPAILHVILPQTTHSPPMASSYFDQIE